MIPWHRLVPWRRTPPLPRPARPVCLIGDIHGRDDLLTALLDRIAVRAGGSDIRIVTLGDMIDRGPGSAAVLSILHTLARRPGADLTCLMGNHERMMLDFLALPEANRAWIDHGGAATLRSFGVASTGRPSGIAAALRRALPAGLEDWIAGLPPHWREGGLAAVHAGADPRVALERQMADTLLWGHPDFGRLPRRDGLWIVHGHTLAPEAPWIRRGTIGLDTGAWQSGTLTAVWLDEGGLDAMQVHAPCPGQAPSGPPPARSLRKRP